MENKELVAIVEAQGMVMTEAQSVVACFQVHLTEAKKLIEEAKTIKVVDENDTEGMDKARSLRLALAHVRVDAEKDRKAFKEESLKKGKTIDLIAKEVSKIIDPIEEELENMEKLALRMAVERKEKALKDRLDTRTARLQPLLLPNTDMSTIFGLKDMPDTAFETLIENSKVVFEAHQAKLAKAEEERLQLERLQREEQERIKIENEKLKAEAILKAEAEKVEREENIRKQKEAQAKYDAELAEQKRISDEKNRIEREAKERAEKELAEIKRKEDEERDSIAKVMFAKEEAERQAQLAPDKEKMFAFADRIRTVELPSGLSPELQKVVLMYANQLCLLADEIKKETEKL